MLYLHSHKLCISLTWTWNEFNNRWNWQNFKIYASHLFRLSAVPRRKYFYSDTWQLMRHIKLYKHSYIILYSQTAKYHHRIFSASAHNFRVCVFILNQICVTIFLHFRLAACWQALNIYLLYLCHFSPLLAIVLPAFREKFTPAFTRHPVILSTCERVIAYYMNFNIYKWVCLCAWLLYLANFLLYLW